jgi:hypothetical protein
MRKNILVETKRLGSGNSLQMCGKVFGIAKNTTSIIVRELC